MSTSIMRSGNMCTTKECVTTVYDVWIWLWQKFNIRIIIDKDNVVYVWRNNEEICSYSIGTSDPEILIEVAIENIICDINVIK